MSIDNLPRRAMSREEARRRTDEFKVHTEAWLEELVSLFLDQVWWSLGYTTWDEYCTAEFGTIRLPRGGRAGAIITLREANMSVRMIASALGIGVGTVHREIAAAGESIQSGNYTIGADGKWQPSSHPTPEIETGVPDGTPDLENEPESVELEPISEPVAVCHIHGSHTIKAVCSVCGARAEDIAISHGVPVEMVFAHPEKFHELGHAHPDPQWRVRKLEENKARLRKLKEHGHVKMREEDLTPQQKLFAVVNHAVTDGITDLDQIAADNDLDPDLVALIWSRSWKLIGEGFCPVCRKPCHDPCPNPNHAAHDPCRR